MPSEVTAYIPDPIFPDGVRREVWEGSTRLRLVHRGGRRTSVVEIELTLPLVKGEPFTFEDFTPGQIAELQRPALDAASVADKTNKAVANAEVERVKAEDVRAGNERSRTSNETLRAGAEGLRVEAERQRASAETLREEAEAARQTNETLREKAERARVTEFDGFKDILDGKQDKLSLSPDFALSPKGELSLTDRAKRALFDEMWNAACGSWGHVDHTHVEDDGVERHYYLNELWLTYAEAIKVWKYTAFSNNYTKSYCRTNIPPKGIWDSFTPTLWFSDIEVLNILPNHTSNPNIQVSQVATFDWYTVKVKRVIGVMKATGKMYTPHARYLPTLEEIKISNIDRNFQNLANAPKVNYNSWRFFVDNATNTTVITVTVHADVYAKLTGDVSNAACAALTDEERTLWQGILTDAAARDISFATA